MAAGRSEKIVDFEPGLRVHSCPAILHIVFDVIPIYAGERDHVQRFEELVIVGAHPHISGIAWEAHILQCVGDFDGICGASPIYCCGQHT